MFLGFRIVLMHLDYHQPTRTAPPMLSQSVHDTFTLASCPHRTSNQQSFLLKLIYFYFEGMHQLNPPSRVIELSQVCVLFESDKAVVAGRENTKTIILQSDYSQIRRDKPQPLISNNSIYVCLISAEQKRDRYHLVYGESSRLLSQLENYTQLAGAKIPPKYSP